MTNSKWVGLFVGVMLFNAVPLYAAAEYNPYADMVSEVFASPQSSALKGADMAINPAGPLVSNPAVAARPQLSALNLSYASYYHGVFSTSILNYTGPAGSNAGLSISTAYLLIPDIEDTRNVDINAVNTDSIERFTSSDIWLRVGYGRKFEFKSATLYYGGAINARRRRLPVIGYGIGLDAGFMLNLHKPSLSFGLLYENVRKGYVRWQGSEYEEYALPHLRFSAAWEKELPYIYGRMTAVYTSPDLLSNEGINSYEDSRYRGEDKVPAMVEYSKNPGMIISNGKYGLEYSIMNTLSLRAGLSQGTYSLGAGLDLFNRSAGVDFCFLSHEIGGTYKMSVTYRWP